MPNDDIVERLRLIAKHVGRVKLGSRATLEPEFCNEISQWIIDGADEIERLRAERDEARREVCNMNESGLRMNDSDKQREAKRRGWDCFKGEA